MYDLLDRQIALEEYMNDEAHARQRSELTKAAQRGESADTRSGRYYLKAIRKPMAERVMGFLNPNRLAGRHHIAAKLLLSTEMEAETISHLATKAVLNLMHGMGTANKKFTGGIKRVTLAKSIAELVHDEWRVRMFKDTKKRRALLAKLFKDFDKRSYPREWRKRTIQNYFDADQISWQGWTDRQKVHIGRALLCIFRESTETMFDGAPLLSEVDGGTKFCLSDAAVQHFAKLSSHQVQSFTLYHPMVVPPRKWTERNLFRGGYVSNRVKRYAVVKGAGKRDVDRFMHMNWDRILPPLNAIQETPWRVNRVMLEALDWAYNSLTKREAFRKHGIGKLVACDPIPFPEEPEGYRTNEEIKKAHNKVCFLIRSRNREDKSRRIAAEMTLKMGKRYADYDAIYFPHNMDSRGRIYPLPAVLNPQGPDYVKALLEFSKGEPIENEEAACWLAIAGANAYGNDKVSLQERVEWVEDHEEMIFSIAADYQHDLRWIQNDGDTVSEPFGFLRFCLEWTAFKEQGYGYVSHMVVPVDATCSGLQHYGAMMRDEIGGRAVNLVPGLERQDIYGDVAKVVIRMLHADLKVNEVITFGKELDEGQQFDDDGKKLKKKNRKKDRSIRRAEVAQGWIDFLITRKETKKQVMVVPYAGKFSSCLAYTREAVADRLNKGYTVSWSLEDVAEHSARTNYLAGLIWKAIDQGVVKGKLAMKWLSEVATQWAEVANGTVVADPYDRRMVWDTPDGFEVLHYREDESRIRLETNFDGRVDLVMYEYNGRLNPSDMALAVAPNFVHALDATLLRATVYKAQDIGIQHFGMIHDSFGCHARHMARFLQECVKPAFVEMYQDNDVLEQFRQTFVEIIPDLAPPPEKGTLDLSGVLSSEFFFS